MEVAARLDASALHRHYVGGRLLQVFGALRRCNDDAGGVVRLKAAVEQMGAGLHDPARVQHIVHGYALLHKRFGVVAGVLAVRNLDGRQVFAGYAVLHHMARECEGEVLHCAGYAVGTLE